MGFVLRRCDRCLTAPAVSGDQRQDVTILAEQSTSSRPAVTDLKLPDERSALHSAVQRMFGFFPKLQQRRNQMAGFLSGGEQQMLAIARALMAAPNVLLLDEPSLGLAPIMVQEIGRLIQKIRSEQGLSIVLVEQNANLALRLCDYAYVLENGRVALSGPGADLAKSEYVQRAYLGV